MIDIYHSRRVHYKLCKYWVRDERNSVGDLSTYIYNKKASGIFYAKQESSTNNRKNQLQNVIMVDESTLTLSTSDKVLDLKSGCIVEYLKKIWLVVGVQRVPHLKETQYSDDEFDTIIAIQRYD